MNQKMMIFVTFEVPGIHSYPDAPEEVSYLRYPHRHLFKFKVGVEVGHDNREIEFHIFKNWCTSQFTSGLYDLNNKSCEMIARDLAARIRDKWATESAEIEVWEDDECGARMCVEY